MASTADDISEMPSRLVFAALPLHLQENTETILELVSAPGLCLKQRMFSKFSGVMDQAEQQGHIEHLRKRMHRNPWKCPLDCDLNPTGIEIEFDNEVLRKFRARCEKLEEDLVTTDTETDTEDNKAKSKVTLANIHHKMNMNQKDRIYNLYHTKIVEKTKEHKAKLAKFALTLTDALLQFTPEFAEQHNLDRKTIRDYVRFHDFQKILQSAPFAGDVFDKDLGATYADFNDMTQTDRALAMFFNACLFHNIIEGTRELGHHPHAAMALTDSPDSDALRQFLRSGTQDFCRVVETMADTMEASFSPRILKAVDVETAANSWLVFASTEFCPGGSQEVPAQELIMRYRILLTNPSLRSLAECNDAVTFMNEAGEKQLMTTVMLKKISPIFEQVALLGESM